MRKTFLVCCLFSLSMLWCFYACLQEDSFIGNNKVDRFFNTFGADENVCWITEQYHSHPAGASFPSWADLKVLATRYQRGQINAANFSYGVVSSMGCFTMVITSESAFSAFAQSVLDNDVDLRDSYGSMLKTKTNGVDSAVAKFIDFLKSSVSGLDVLFNEASYNSSGNARLGNWQAKDSNGSANISNYNCN